MLLPLPHMMIRAFIYWNVCIEISAHVSKKIFRVITNLGVQISIGGGVGKNSKINKWVTFIWHPEKFPIH